MTANVLEVRKLSKSYVRGDEQVHAVEEAAFSLRKGELVALIGPSGSGKTTLLNLMMGWERPDAGRILWTSGDEATPVPQWSQLAMVPQSLGLLEELTIRENVALPSTLGAHGAAEERVTNILDSLGLVELGDRIPSEVSLGEQQRAAVARAVVVSPLLLVADEPTGHQDAEWAHGVFAALRDACRAGTTCLVATHNEEALTYADRVLTMEDGRLAAEVPA
jgi:putative ABC transport system ATP-binding protein